MYASRAYEQLVDDNVKYKTKLLKIPTPEFYVFYNGARNTVMEQELILSDAFFSPARENSIELKVKVININSDKAHKVLEKCQILKEYTLFVESVRKRKGNKHAIKEVINDSISNRLKEIFEYIGKNYNISIVEWNHDIDHVHILFKAEPNRSLSKFINAYKSASSRLVKKEYPSIRMQLWREFF